MSQLSRAAQAGLSAPASQPVGQAKVKEPPSSRVLIEKSPSNTVESSTV